LAGIESDPVLMQRQDLGGEVWRRGLGKDLAACARQVEAVPVAVIVVIDLTTLKVKSEVVDPVPDLRWHAQQWRLDLVHKGATIESAKGNRSRIAATYMARFSGAARRTGGPFTFVGAMVYWLNI
jgi:hypothetical protein